MQTYMPGLASTSTAAAPAVSAFGEALTTVNTPVFAGDAVYGIVDQISVADAHNGGSATASNGLFTCQTSATTESSAYIRSDHPLTYYPGVGSMCRFTAMFTAGTATSWQLAGLSNVETFLQVGYRYGTAFGVHRGTGGEKHVHKFTVTTGASVEESVTITLDGDTKSVAVTANNDVEQTAWEIAAADYDGVGDGGWHAYAEGAIVYFISERAEVIAGAFSLSGETGSLAITIAEEQAGTAPTVTSETAFNVDALDGDGASGMTIDPTKLNVFQVDFQYLGAGQIEFQIEDPTTGKFVVFHRIQYANTNTTPSLSNPTMFFRIEAYNGSGTDDVTCYSASFAGFHQGIPNQLGPRYGASYTKTGIGTSFVPICSVRGASFFNGRVSLVETHVERLGISVEGTKGAVFAIVRDGVLDNTANFAAVDASSATLIDTTATSLTGGHQIYTMGVADNQHFTDKDLDALLTFDKDEIITVIGKSTSSTTGITVSVVLHEEL